MTSRKRRSFTTFENRDNACQSLTGSDNFEVDVSMSQTNVSTNDRRNRSCNEKLRIAPTCLSRRVGLIGKQARTRNGRSTSGIPKDVAVHFGKFYDVSSTKKRTGRNGETTKAEFPAVAAPRFEFTRQMVHELERLAGTEHYARQVSALLDSTVESSNFHVKPLPIDNFVIHENSKFSDYPLWYKQPDDTASSIELNHAYRTNKTFRTNNNCAPTKSMVIVPSGSRPSYDFPDYENNEESLSSLEYSSCSSANTEDDDGDYDDVNVPIYVE